MGINPLTVPSTGETEMCVTTHRSKCGGFRVLVVNRTYIGPSEYIGRPFGRDAGSVLGNPRSLREGWERGETIMHYRRELRAALDRTVKDAWWNGRLLSEDERAAMRREMNRLFQLLSQRSEVVLRCFCAPAACHGDEIVKVLLETLERWRLAVPGGAAPAEPVERAA